MWVWDQSRRWSNWRWRLAQGSPGGARGVEPFERRLLVGGWFSAEVGDAKELVTFGEDGGDERVAVVEEVVDRRHGDGAVSDQLAGLAVDREAAQEGVEVDSEEQLDRRPPPNPSPPGSAWPASIRGPLGARRSESGGWQSGSAG